MSEEARRLPVGYYLLNFETVLREVRARYGDLLRPGELARMEAFLALPEPARRLYVRMLTRKGPWFREDGLNYAEVGPPAEALAVLHGAGFCERPTALQEWVPLLDRTELAGCLQRLGLQGVKGLRRDGMVEALLQGADPAWLEAELRALLRPVKPLHTELWDLLSFLFFGNDEQDLSSFVLADIGRLRYETYPLDPTVRLFQSREDIDFLFSLRALRTAFEEAEARGDDDGMRTLTAEVLAMDPHPGIRQQRRYHRLLNELGQAWERRRETALAAGCYSRSQLPPARERLARLAGDPVEACRQAILMAATALDLSEARFARTFLKRHARRVPEADQWLREHPGAEPLPDLHLTASRQASVETAALEVARTLGWDGFFAENVLWRALFGIAFWDVLFAPVPGAFQHRFQAAPLDLRHPGFFARREPLIERRLGELGDRAGLLRQVLGTAEAKWGIANAFLSWRHLTPEMLAAAVERVPPQVLVSVLRTMAQSPWHFTRGFPDLFLFKPAAADWALWEVKGPGDSLRPEQEYWLEHFRRMACEVRVAHLRWEP